MSLRTIADIAVVGVVPSTLFRSFPFCEVGAYIMLGRGEPRSVRLLDNHGGVAEDGDVGLSFLPCVGLRNENNAHGGAHFHVRSQYVELVKKLSEKKLRSFVGRINSVPDHTEVL